MIKIKHKGNFSKTEKFLKKALTLDFYKGIEKYAKEGVRALESATPIDSGITSGSWGYEIKTSKDGISIYWNNTNINDGIPIAILIQYGHGTRNGGYVQGIDFINPALKPVFEKIANSVWKEVASL